MKEDKPKKIEDCIKEAEKKIEKLNLRIKELEREKEKYLLGWKRERADFLNYKKEEEQRLNSFKKLIEKDIIKDLLRILESFERAENQITQDLVENPIIRGFLGIKKQLQDFLKKYKVEEIKINKGDEFDPQVCEAVEIVMTKNDDYDNKIAEIIEKGFIIDNNQVLKPVKVKVFKKVAK